MRASILTLLFLLISQGLFAQKFTINEKGTVKCPNASRGEKGVIFGVTYEAVDRSLLETRLITGDASKLCTSLVTDLSFLFRHVPNFNQPIGSWDVSNVTDMRSMFNQVTGKSPFNQPIGNWDVSNVENMHGMFMNSQFNQPIGEWNVSKVINMSRMFQKTPFNQEISNWDVSKVKTMHLMFSDASLFNQFIGDWNVSNVTDMGGMFYVSSNFNQPLGNWDVGNVTNMSSMFSHSAFNQPIGEWDVKNVVTMTHMFAPSPFNQNIRNWCVINIKTDSDSFAGGSPLLPENMPIWGTCPGIPAKITQTSPTHNFVGASRKPALSWMPDSNATNYRLQLFEGFDPMILDTTVKNINIAVNRLLKPNQDYYWKVQGINGTMKRTGDWSDIRKFTTGVTTGVEKESLPNLFILSQNFPNPFNPTTQISFTLPRSASVRLEVFNSLGQPVSVIAEGMLPAGAHTYAFDGAALSSGVYLYRLTTPDFVQTRVMALVK